MGTCYEVEFNKNNRLCKLTMGIDCLTNQKWGVYTVFMPEAGVFERVPIYRRAWFWAILLILLFSAALGYSFLPEIRTLINGWPILFGQSREGIELEDVNRAIGVLSTQLIMGVGILVFGLLLVSQFVLPVQTLDERLRVFQRLFLFMLGRHGPAIRVREGKQIARLEELRSYRPGVALIDLCSAVALEQRWVPLSAQSTQQIATRRGRRMSRQQTDQQMMPLVRVAGPGISFTEFGERIRGVVDLRRQFRLEYPVSGATREGFSIQAPVWVLFTLGEAPECFPVVYEGAEEPDNLRAVILDQQRQTIRELRDEFDADDKQEIHSFAQRFRFAQDALDALPPRTQRLGRIVQSPYLFDPNRVFAAIYAQARNPQDDRIMEWHELPLQVTVEEFRYVLAQEHFDELLHPEDRQLFPLADRVRPMLSRSVRNMGVLNYQFIRHKIDEPFQVGMLWDETQLDLYPEQPLTNSKVLRDRGIKVIAAGFAELRPVHQGIQAQLSDYVRANLQSEAIQIDAQQTLQAMRIRARARAMAQRDMLYTLSRIFNLQNLPRQALVVRIFQALETIAADPRTRQLLPPNTIDLLWDIHQYILPRPVEGE